MKRARRNVSRKNLWRKRQIILPPELVEELFAWHGGQFTPTYALASTGFDDLVSLSMLDAALTELERDVRATKGNAKKELANVVAGVEGIRWYWKESSAREAGMGLSEDEYEYDHQDYGMDADEEKAIDTRSR